MKSVIICDMEGLITNMNEGAEKVFGYPSDELVGIKRVSIFSPGEIVLQKMFLAGLEMPTKQVNTQQKKLILLEKMVQNLLLR